MLVEKTGYLGGTDVSATLQEAPSKRRDGVGMAVDEIGEHLDEAALLVHARYLVLLPREQRRQRVQVVAIDAGDVGVRDHDERQVAQSVDAVGQPGRQQGQREVGGFQESVLGERRRAMSIESATTKVALVGLVGDAGNDQMR